MYVEAEFILLSTGHRYSIEITVSLCPGYLSGALEIANNVQSFQRSMAKRIETTHRWSSKKIIGGKRHTLRGYYIYSSVCRWSVVYLAEQSIRKLLPILRHHYAAREFASARQLHVNTTTNYSRRPPPWNEKKLRAVIPV